MDLKTKERLLRIRKTKQQQRPSFVRVESWRYKKLKKSGWKKQRGIDNKTRRKTKSGVKSPEPGYRSPKKIRNLHPSGLEDILVMHKEDLESLSPKKHGLRIAHRLGNRKKLDLIEFAREKGFKILNVSISKRDLTELEQPLDEEIDEEIDDEEEKYVSRKDQISKLKENQSASDDKEDKSESEEDVEEK